MKRINSARLTKLKHKQHLQDRKHWKKMEEMFGKNTDVDDIDDIEAWQKAQEMNGEFNNMSLMTEEDVSDEDEDEDEDEKSKECDDDVNTSSFKTQLKNKVRNCFKWLFG